MFPLNYQNLVTLESIVVLVITLIASGIVLLKREAGRISASADHRKFFRIGLVNLMLIGALVAHSLLRLLVQQLGIQAAIEVIQTYDAWWLALTIPGVMVNMIFLEYMYWPRGNESDFLRPLRRTIYRQMAALIWAGILIIFEVFQIGRDWFATNGVVAPILILSACGIVVTALHEHLSVHNEESLALLVISFMINVMVLVTNYQWPGSQIAWLSLLAAVIPGVWTCLFVEGYTSSSKLRLMMQISLLVASQITLLTIFAKIGG